MVINNLNKEKKLKYCSCKKCDKNVLEETITTLNSHFGINEYLCNDCFKSLTKVINNEYNKKFQKFIDKIYLQEYKIYKKFLKGKYDLNLEPFDGCLLYIIIIVLVGIIFIGLTLQYGFK